MSAPEVVRDGDVGLTTWSDPVRGHLGFRTLLGGDRCPGDFTAGIAELAVGGWLGLHRHDPAELYHVLEGEGEVTVDGRRHAVGRGTTVHVPGSSEHAVRNTGTGVLRFFYVFAVDSFEQVEYDFGGGRTGGPADDHAPGA